MSAFLVSNDHINAIVTFGTRHLPHNAVDRAGLAHMLTWENMRSLYSRYDDTAEWTVQAAAYAYAPVTCEATQIVKLCDCFDYQACETDDYESTPAAAFVDAVREAAVRAGGHVRGKAYDTASWDL